MTSFRGDGCILAEQAPAPRLLGGAGLAAALGNPLRALADDGAPVIDVSKWSPEYVDSIAGTIEVDTAAECAKVVPLDYKGHLTYWYVGPERGLDPAPAQARGRVLGGLRQDLPEHHGREAEHRLQRHPDQAPDGGAGPGGTDGGPPDAALGCRVRRQGPARRAQARGCRLPVGRLLAAGDELGQLAGQAVRHPDQQRDHGVHLERADLRGGRARSREGRPPPGPTSSPTPSRSRRRRARTATAWWPASMPATRPTGSCRRPGPMAAGPWTRPSPIRPTRRS